MTSKVVRSTDRGQITLPKEWRDNFHTDSYLVEMRDDKLIVFPLNVDTAKEEVLFDAERDNDSKGISPDEIIRALRKL